MRVIRFVFSFILTLLIIFSPSTVYAFESINVSGDWEVEYYVNNDLMNLEDELLDCVFILKIHPQPKQ